MSVLLNLLNELGKIDTMRGLPSIYHFFATSLINSVIQDHEYVLNSIRHFTLSVLWNCVAKSLPYLGDVFVSSIA